MNSDGRLPNLFIVGAPKCGTTMLANVLAKQEDVYLSTVKEPGFFLSDSQYRRGIDYYVRSYFPPEARNFDLRCEATPWYLYSTEARDRIRKHCGLDLRLIVLLRSPVARAYSMFLDQVHATAETRSFVDAILSELDGLELGDALVEELPRRYAWCGLYAGFIESWFEVFGRDRVHVGFLEHAGSDRFWADLAGFLGIGSIEGWSAPVDSNPATRPRSIGLNRILRRMKDRDSAIVSTLRRLVPSGWDRRALEKLATWNRAHGVPPEHSEIPDEVAQRLQSFFEDDRNRLEALLGTAPPWP